ncbi:hypothetical protein Hamer_G024945, partial [Homarus americanus]
MRYRHCHALSRPGSPPIALTHRLEERASPLWVADGVGASGSASRGRTITQVDDRSSTDRIKRNVGYCAEGYGNGWWWSEDEGK